ncbi:uncharacterized protein LOC103710077 isoform X1 [Phoenix dactylifera]|uniref:Uncharacterized protein LOC103710077 isoform X1 n=2 Tax=Phoenix dactylifera TaxID=42345 RepID=A0A8B9A3C8_PHODC|nr:uncharacterized protein LOC103710077 isoform X1 [Phoenix dactylifera]XP_038980162.1 uncharacterized protein LOC103710077 isoform X1 [Phoenix dactylifera]
MPVSDHDELGVNLLAQQSGDSIAGVPIKKRRFILSQFSSPPTQTPSLPPEDSERPWKKSYISEAESSASDSSAQPALGTDFITDGSLEAKGESLDNRDVNTACRLENHTEPNVQELGLKTATSAIKGTSVVKDSNMDDKSALWSGMQNNQLLSTAKRPSVLPVGERSGEGKFASSDKSAFQRVASMSGWQLASSRDGKDDGDGSVKQDKVDHLSYDLPLDGRHTIYNNYSNFSSRVDPVHHYVNRSNWDLNVPMDTWDSSASVSVMVQDGHDSSTSGGIPKQKLVARSVQMTPGESSNMLQKSNNLRLGNFSMSSDDHNGAEVGLDLQLKPPSRPELCINWGAMAPPDLSLSLAGTTTDISSKAVKPEPYEEVSPNGTRKVEMVSLKSVDFRHVKSEPCDGSSQDKDAELAGSGERGKDAELAGSGENKSARAGMVKSEPPEEPSQEFLKRLTGQSPDMESDNHRLMLHFAEGRPHTSETKAMDLNSEAVSVNDELHDGSKMPASAEIPASESVGATAGLVPEAVIPDCTKNDHRELHNSTCLFQDEGNDIKISDLASKSQISEGKGLNSVSETCEVAGQASNSLTEPVVSDGVKGRAVFDGMSEGSAEMDFSDDDNIVSSNLVAMDEHQVDSYGNSKVGGSAQERINLSADNQAKQSSYNEHGSINFHTAHDARAKTLQQRDGDDEYEDGRERKCLSRKGSKAVLDKETTDTIGPTDMPTVMPSDMDAEKKETDPDEMKTGRSTEKIISVLCNSNNDVNLSSTKVVHESSVMEVPKAASSKTKLIKTFGKITENHPLKERGSEMMAKSTGSPSAKKSAKSSEGDKDPRQENRRGSVPSAKHLISSKKYSPLNGVAIKHFDGWDRNSQIKKVTSAPDRSSFGKTKSLYARSISSQTERERSTDKSHRRERSHSRGTRNDRCSDRTLKYESGKNEDQPVDKHGSDYINNRKSDDRLGALYCNRNSGPPRDPELHDQKSFRFSRPCSRGEGAFAVESNGSVGNTGRIWRRPPEDEPPRLSRFPPRRRSPGPREGPVPLDAQIAGPSVRDVSPSRYIGRDVPDPFLLSREEKVMRALPDDMMDPLPFPHPRLLYERVDNDLIWRQRRSHSPINRRIPARLHRAHSPHQWSPSRRSSDALDGHPELLRCRSPPVFRMDRLRSPRQHPCFPEDVMVRRRGSPPPFPRLLDDMRDIHPLEEHDLPRPGRVLQRNIRRFDLIGPHESADEEYFGPFPGNQLHELEGNDEFDGRNKFDERRNFLHPFLQRPVVSDDGENCLPYPVGDVPRPIRFCPEAEEMFPDRGGPRDFDGRIGNRLGNMPNRLRGMAERGDDYRYHGAPGWRDGGLNDARLKRRRL